MPPGPGGPVPRPCVAKYPAAGAGSAEQHYLAGRRVVGGRRAVPDRWTGRRMTLGPPGSVPGPGVVEPSPGRDESAEQHDLAGRPVVGDRRRAPGRWTDRGMPPGPGGPAPCPGIAQYPVASLPAEKHHVPGGRIRGGRSNETGRRAGRRSLPGPARGRASDLSGPSSGRPDAQQAARCQPCRDERRVPSAARRADRRHYGHHSLPISEWPRPGTTQRLRRVFVRALPAKCTRWPAGASNQRVSSESA